MVYYRSLRTNSPPSSTLKKLVSLSTQPYKHPILFMNSHTMSATLLERLIYDPAMHVDSCKEHRCHNTCLHVAAIVKRGKVLATAQNRIGSRSKGSGYSKQTIHAERAVVKKLGDISKLRGATLCV